MLELHKLPLAIEALGLITWDGVIEAQSQPQFENRGDLLILREQDYFIQESFAGHMCWWKIPSCATKARWEELPFSLQLANVINHQGASITPILRSPSKEMPLFDPRGSFIHDLPSQLVASPDKNLELCAALEEAIASGNLDNINIDFTKPPPCHPRWMFAYGALLVKSGKPAAAKRFFHIAGRLGHPDGLNAEWSTHELISREFRADNPGLFEEIEAENGVEALGLIDELPNGSDELQRSVAEAYACRIAGANERGVKAAIKALSIDNAQSDILAHLAAFYISLGNDTNALEVSQQLIREYPTYSQGYHDALHSSLLLGKGDLAYFFAQGHLLHSKSPESALKSIFAFHEATADWENLELAFNSILPEIRRPMPSTMVAYAEVLTERGKFDRSIEILKSIVANNPELPDAVLALGRALARCGREAQAIKHITTILADDTRHDSPESRALFVSFLSELLRRTGNSMSAMALWRWESKDTSLGPRPLAEFIECLTEIGDRAEALSHFPKLKKMYPHDPITAKIGAKLGL
jgi:tetratricopeptide (TPR) repeat protein